TEEFNDGTIPTSVHIDFARNNFKDGTYKPVRQILILYDDFNIAPDDTVIVFCKTSVRAAQTFLALYNAGYRDVKVYDAAWLGWSADSSLPVQRPNGDRVAPTVQDGS
ncbi:MAG: rhodanese-like domain-containing protein, partial [Spirochaetota bacterium]